MLGQPAPYWFHAVRDRDAFAAWRPGAPPAVVPARDIATPVTALAELAVDEPDGSPAAELCLYLAREVRRRGHASTTRNIDELRENAAEGGDGAHLVLGAVPAPLARPAPQEPTEMVRRAGWLAITERRDVLAHRVADFAQRWDGGQDWHTGAVTSVHPETCSTAHEWAQRLIPAAGGQPPTVLEKVLLDNGRDTDNDILLHDPVAGIPVLHRSPGTRHANLFTYALQRLPTTSPLAALILSDNNCWIRTQNGTLWLAPEREGWGIGYGYSGNGCHALADLTAALLVDISAPRHAPTMLMRLAACSNCCETPPRTVRPSTPGPSCSPLIPGDGATGLPPETPSSTPAVACFFARMRTGHRGQRDCRPRLRLSGRHPRAVWYPSGLPAQPFPVLMHTGSRDPEGSTSADRSSGRWAESAADGPDARSANLPAAVSQGSVASRTPLVPCARTMPV